MYGMLISVEKGKYSVRVKKGKPKLGLNIAIFVKFFFNLWFYNRLVLAPNIGARNISLLRVFGPVFTPKASEENVGKDTFQFLTTK